MAKVPWRCEFCGFGNPPMGNDFCMGCGKTNDMMKAANDHGLEIYHDMMNPLFPGGRAPKEGELPPPRFMPPRFGPPGFGPPGFGPPGFGPPGFGPRGLDLHHLGGGFGRTEKL
ncbi:hypothetical protein CC86DRAFT_403036 [Ophiobolus disseminans]|uniref:Uncharacterized protein n=1 Tax=Ophiobolus disseminans TaxID=1469910 RepID=A0A6A7A8R6_9PLEO|nr:hypothetical protein CC86DRAFT_403036 [Ophiobolus disseminans]